MIRLLVCDIGEGVKKDYEEAFKWFRLAANQGDNKAQNKLGTMYYIRKGVKKDEMEAFKWYQLAADQGNIEAINMIE